MPVFALIDCNSFYCSCEELINPRLKGRPGVVLSNNDGMAIALNRLAKEMDIGLDPFHLNKAKWDAMGIWYRSSNYPLYANLSGRVMAVLRTFSPQIEIYSCDEAFVDITGLVDYNDYGLQIKRTIEQWIGIPVSVGIAKTKTLCKIASRMAKTSKKNRSGVVTLLDPYHIDVALLRTPIGKVWGVGRQYAEHLRSLGITSAYDLAKADKAFIKKRFNVVLGRTASELDGTFCLPLIEAQQLSKSVSSSMSFGKMITELYDLRQVLSTYAAATAEKMRLEGLACHNISVYLQTNEHLEDEPQYNPYLKIKLPHATDFTGEIISYAMESLESIYKPGYRYMKGGIVVDELIPTTERQTDMFDAYDREKVARINKALDTVNQVFGFGTLRLGSQGHRNSRWRTRANHLSSITKPSRSSQYEHLPRTIELAQAVPLYRAL